VEQQADMARQQDDKEMGNELGLSTPESPSGRVEMATRSRSVPGSRTTSPPVKADESAFAKLDSTFLLQSTARRQLTDAAGAATATDTRRDVRPSTSTAEEYATPRGQEASNMRRTGGANESLTPSSRRDSLLPQLLADDAMINQSQALTTCEFVNEDQMLDARLQVWENKHEARAKKGDVRLGAIETRLNQKRDIAEYPTVACDTMKEELEELKETVRSIQDKLPHMTIDTYEAKSAAERLASICVPTKNDLSALTDAVVAIQDKIWRHDESDRQDKSLAEAMEANNKTVRQALSTLLERFDILAKKEDRFLPMLGSTAGGDTQHQITTETPVIHPGHTQRRTDREAPELRDPQTSRFLPLTMPGITADSRMFEDEPPAQLNQVEDPRLDYDGDRRRDYGRDQRLQQHTDFEILRNYNPMARRLGEPTPASPAQDRKVSRWEDSVKKSSARESSMKWMRRLQNMFKLATKALTRRQQRYKKAFDASIKTRRRAPRVGDYLFVRHEQTQERKPWLRNGRKAR